MDLFGSIPAPIWAIAAIAVCAWYVFGRGKGKKFTKKGLSRLRREEEASKRRLNIVRNEEKIAEIEQKKRKQKKEDLPK